MFSRVPAVPTHEQESSEQVSVLAGQLRVQADAIDSVRERLRSAKLLDWQSPAGRNFSAYLAQREESLAATAATLRDTALSVDAYGRALAQAEDQRVLGL